MRESYGRFAAVYDRLMFDVSYEEIADFIEELFRKNERTPELVLDLACGTGSLTKVLAERGYDMIGADASAEMLMEARRKNGTILYLNQPMQELELYGTVDVIVCVLDSLNYLTEDGELEQVFTLCNNYLNPDGLLLFDVNSEYKFRRVLADNIFSYDKDGIFYVWENRFCPKSRLCEFYLTFFSERSDGAYTRFDEIHTERCYTDAEITSALTNAGFTVAGKYDGYSLKKAGRTSERIFYECKNTDPIQLRGRESSGSFAE